MPTIYDAYGRTVNLSELTREIATVNVSSVRTPFFPSVANGLTPERLAQIIAAVDQNDAHEYLTLAEEMEERDLHYHSVLSTRKLGVAGLKLRVEARTDKAADVKVAEEIQAVLDSDVVGDLLTDVLDALGKGFSVNEIMWDRSAKQWEPAGYESRDGRFFQFDRETGRELRLRDESDTVNGVALAPYKFIVHRPRIKTGLTLRTGLARLAAVAYMCKGYALKDWLAFAEVFGMPLRLGRYGASATADEKRALLRAVTNIGADAAAIVPESMAIEFIAASQGAGGDKLFVGLADWLDKQVSKGVLGQVATTEGTPGKLGNENAQENVREDIRNSDARQLASTLRRDLVRPYVDLNYGPPASAQDYPIVRLELEKPEDLALLAQALPPFIQLGLKVEASVIRDKFGLPEPEEGADVLGPAAPPAPPSGGDLGGGPADGGPEPDDEEPPPEPPADLEDEESPPEEPPAKATSLRDAATVLLQRALAGATLTEDQRALLALAARQGDDDVDALVAAQGSGWRRVLDPMLEPIERLAERCTSAEEFQAELDALELDKTELTQAVATLAFTARGLGDATDEVGVKRAALATFDENQPRADDGKWTSGAGGGGQPASTKSDEPKVWAPPVEPKFGKPGSAGATLRKLLYEQQVKGSGLSDDAIFKKMQDEHKLSDDKRWYLNWYKADMRKKGLLPPKGAKTAVVETKPKEAPKIEVSKPLTKEEKFIKMGWVDPPKVEAPKVEAAYKAPMPEGKTVLSPEVMAKIGKPGTPSHEFRKLILEGKLSDKEIFAAVQAKYPQVDNSKKGYVQWYRYELKKKGILPGYQPKEKPAANTDALKPEAVKPKFDAKVAEVISQPLTSTPSTVFPAYSELDGTFKNAEMSAADHRLKQAASKQWTKLAAEERSALTGYTANSTRLNAFVTGTYNPQKDPVGNQSAHYKQRAARLDAVLDKTRIPENVTVFRAMDVRSLGIDHNDFKQSADSGSVRKHLDGIVGSTFKDPAYGSTSIKANVAKGFLRSERLMLRVKVPAGTRGFYFGSSSSKTMYASERELLLPRNTMYKVEKVEWYHGKPTVTVRVVSGQGGQ